jgi:hypothetical protein
MMTFASKMREQVPKLRIFVRQQGAHFRVVYQRDYPQAVEEVIYTVRFATTEEAQKFVDIGLRAQRIYRSLMGYSFAHRPPSWGTQAVNDDP